MGSLHALIPQSLRLALHWLDLVAATSYLSLVWPVVVQVDHWGLRGMAVHPPIPMDLGPFSSEIPTQKPHSFSSGAYAFV